MDMMKLAAEVTATKLAFSIAAAQFLMTYDQARADLVKAGLSEEMAESILKDTMNGAKKAKDQHDELERKWIEEGKDPREERDKLIAKAEAENPELKALGELITEHIKGNK